jgi:hypothetical protein
LGLAERIDGLDAGQTADALQAVCRPPWESCSTCWSSSGATILH